MVADQEEGGAGIILAEQPQDLGCEFGGGVVDCEGDGGLCARLEVGDVPEDVGVFAGEVGDDEARGFVDEVEGEC